MASMLEQKHLGYKSKVFFNSMAGFARNILQFKTIFLYTVGVFFVIDLA